MLNLLLVMLITGSLAAAQDLFPPPVEQVARQMEPAPRLPNFIRAALSPPIPQGRAATASERDYIVYKVGNGVTAPRPVDIPDPRYPEKLRRRGKQGSVSLWLIVGKDGTPKHVRIARSAGPEFDREAIQAVNQWRFEPGTKDGQPVAVEVNVEVSFRNY